MTVGWLSKAFALFEKVNLIDFIQHWRYWRWGSWRSCCNAWPDPRRIVPKLLIQNFNEIHSIFQMKTFKTRMRDQRQELKRFASAPHPNRCRFILITSCGRCECFSFCSRFDCCFQSQFEIKMLMSMPRLCQCQMLSTEIRYAATSKRD